MNLVVDVGNTTVKAALFEGAEMKALYQTAADVRNAITHQKISHCLISKTGSDHPLEELLSAQTFRVRYFTYSTKLPFKNIYSTPETIGTDRLALVAGAMQLFPKHNLLCIDTGTCITYNFVNSNKEFLGGSIAPGIEMRFKSLHHFTARLPLVKWNMNEFQNKTTSDTLKQTNHLPVALIGNSTEGSILSGVLNGIAAETDAIINIYKKSYKTLKVVVTGGSLPFFASALENAIFARPNLVLYGLNAILEYNS